MRNRGVVRPVEHGKQSIGRCRLIFENVPNDAVTIDGVGQCLPDLSVFQYGMSEVYANVLKRSARVGLNDCIGILFQPWKGVGLDIVLQKLNGSFFEL